MAKSHFLFHQEERSMTIVPIKRLPTTYPRWYAQSLRRALIEQGAMKEQDFVSRVVVDGQPVWQFTIRKHN